jgi:hypothetical protein
MGWRDVTDETIATDLADFPEFVRGEIEKIEKAQAAKK